VPSFGVLTTGVKWLFYKFEPQSKTLYESEPLFLPLERHITASEAQKLALPVVELLLHIIQQQKKTFEDYKKACR
jgi:hypothetical protein